MTGREYLGAEVQLGDALGTRGMRDRNSRMGLGYFKGTPVGSIGGPSLPQEKVEAESSASAE